jgi:hypothetical protein
MGVPREPPPVKLIASLFSGDETLLAMARGALINRWGPLDYESDLLAFTHTSYYAREFGDKLVRQIVAFSRLIKPDDIASIKRATNELESEWTVEGCRRVNVDPGYVSLGKLVLATTKDYAHRIYLGQGIYAEVTLQYRKGAFRGVEYTYPDYASAEYLEIFHHIRSLYAAQTHERTVLAGL